MKLADLPTPSLLLDRPRLVRNCERMRALAARHGVILRPHAKTHKCAEIARLQHGGELGPLTVSTLAEAEGFAAAGFRDLTYAVPIEPGKFARALALARDTALRLVTDDRETVLALAEAARRAGVRPAVLMEVDCGDHRCGVDPESAEAIALASTLADAPSLDFAGLLSHAGHAYAGTTDQAVRAVARAEREQVVALALRLRAAGIAVDTVSIGSTPTMTHATDFAGITEIRPGNYAFFDAFQAAHGSCTLADCALSVLTAVIHCDRSRNRLVVDAGAIALSKDLGPRDVEPGAGFGRLLTVDGRELGARVTSVSQEHGQITLPPATSAADFPVGTRLRIVANHSCLTAAQHRVYHVLEADEVVARWTPFSGW
jgi:D-serine deaminase-like pyridoxal phosphate-dependent protein